MKQILNIRIILILAISLLAVSCKKKEDTKTTTPTQAKYYFNFTLDGVAKTYRSNSLQTGHGFFQDQIGGYVMDGESIGSDMMGLTIYKNPPTDSLTHAEAIALQGQSLFFDDATYMVNLNLQITESGVYELYNTIDEGNHSFKITITSVVLTSSGTGINKYNIYEVKGTCSGKLENDFGTKIHTITNGEFYARFTKGIL